MNALILAVEDDENLLDILKFNLESEGYDVITAVDGEKAIERAFSFNPDLILLDVMIPKKDGFQVCNEIRKKSNVPIIMVTAKSEEVDRVLGLEIGADDYIVKPYARRELLARVKANLRRVNDFSSDKLNKNEDILNFDELKIDLNNYEVYLNDEKVDLTSREFELLKYLILGNGKIFKREDLLKEVWEYDYLGDVRTVDVTIRRLREKIEPDCSNPKFILTKWGVGYYFSRKGV